MENIKRTAGDIAGELKMGDSGGGRIVLNLAMENYRPFERDQLSDCSPE